MFCIVFWSFAVLVLRRAELTSGERTIRVACLTVPAIVIVGTWLAWKMSYYGEVLPNTYYVKGAGLSLEVLKQGAWYVGSFLWNYLLIVFVCLGIWKPKLVGTLPAVHWTVALVGLWCLYVIKVGGDFMEYRMLVPILPFALVLSVRILWGLRSAKLQAALVCVLLLASLRHAITYAGQDGFESIAGLEHHVRPVGQGWATIGSVLGEIFQDSPHPVIIATTAAGAIPYYSKLRAIDMLGLNDRWIANHGIDTGARSGHSKCATLEYLLETNVNLVLGHPQISPIAAPGTIQPQDLWCAPIDASSLPKAAKIIEIPFDARRKIEVLYLQQHDYVDEVIQLRGLVTRDIVR